MLEEQEERKGKSKNRSIDRLVIISRRNDEKQTAAQPRREKNDATAVGYRLKGKASRTVAYCYCASYLRSLVIMPRFSFSIGLWT